MTIDDLILGDKKTLLTTEFAARLAELLTPLFNVRVFDANGTEYQVRYTDANVAITLKAISEGGTTTGGMVFKGLWTPGETAAFQEVWKVATGSYAGVYVCVNSEGTTSNPWQGQDWVSLSQTNAIGAWT